MSTPISSNDNHKLQQDAYALLNLIASYELNGHADFQVNGNTATDKKDLTGLSQGQVY
ncbi:hypothetical protein ACX1NX_07445 [Acinetobacter sp. ANC 5383]